MISEALGIRLGGEGGGQASFDDAPDEVGGVWVWSDPPPPATKEERAASLNEQLWRLLPPLYGGERPTWVCP